MRRSSWAFAAGAAWLLLLVTGCGSAPTGPQVAADLFPSGHYERVQHLRLGPVTMALVRGVLALAEDEGEASGLGHIRRIDVSSYRVAEGGGSATPAFERRLASHGWNLVARSRDGDDDAWVYLRADERGRPRQLFVIARAGDELDVVRLEGRFDRLLAEQMAQDPDLVLELFE
ncbi:MAG: DUF4252 domain-containing protein [Acidobacteriota bacterium]